MSMVDVREAKAELRQQIWQALLDSGQGRGAVVERIPDFVGSEQAADRLAELEVWQRARTVMVNPDRAQQPVRARALADGKLLFMAVPNLAKTEPFYRLDPSALDADAVRAADRRVAAELAPTVPVSEMPLIDLIVCGSVAVNRQGVRIGKGAGYSDREIGMLKAAGLCTESTIVVTTVHALQMVEGRVPEEEHDARVDGVVTGAGVIWLR